MNKDSKLTKFVSVFIAAALLAANPAGVAYAGFTAVTGKAAVGAAPVAAPIGLIPGLGNAPSLSVPAASLQLEGSLPSLALPSLAAPASALNAASPLQTAAAATGLRFVTATEGSAPRAAAPSAPAAARILIKDTVASEAAVTAAPIRREGTLHRIGLALKQRSWAPLFDGSRPTMRSGAGFGIQAAEPQDAGIELDPQPAQPEETEVPRVSWK